MTAAPLEAPAAKTTFSCLGLSSDWRTNRWRLALECGHSVEPPTTMFAQQVVSCDRCMKTYVVDYNAKTCELAY
jgi:hypothetical protein